MMNHKIPLQTYCAIVAVNCKVCLLEKTVEYRHRCYTTYITNLVEYKLSAVAAVNCIFCLLAIKL